MSMFGDKKGLVKIHNEPHSAASLLDIASVPNGFKLSNQTFTLEVEKANFLFIPTYITLLIKTLSDIDAKKGTIKATITLLVRISIDSLPEGLVEHIKKKLGFRICEETFEFTKDMEGLKITEKNGMVTWNYRGNITVPFVAKVRSAPFEEFSIPLDLELTSSIWNKNRAVKDDKKDGKKDDKKEGEKKDGEKKDGEKKEKKSEEEEEEKKEDKTKADQEQKDEKPKEEKLKGEKPKDGKEAKKPKEVDPNEINYRFNIHYCREQSQNLSFKDDYDKIPDYEFDVANCKVSLLPEFKRKKEVDQYRYYPKIRFSLQCLHDPWNMLLSMIFPLYFLQMLSLAIFAQDASQFSNKLGNLSTIMLALLAYVPTVRGSFPAVSYFTFCDYCIYTALFINAAVLIDSVVGKLYDGLTGKWVLLAVALFAIFANTMTIIVLVIRYTIRKKKINSVFKQEKRDGASLDFKMWYNDELDAFKIPGDVKHIEGCV